MPNTLQQGWQRFLRNRLAMVCLGIFGLVLMLCCMAPWIANDKPLLLRYQSQWYFPIVKQYPETTFGGVFESEADYKDPAVQALIAQHGWMLMPLIEFSDQSANLDLAVPVPSPPSAQNWLGTDDQARDVLARILYALRISLIFGLCLSFASVLLSIVVGALQGYFAGWVDLFGQRLIEVWYGLPQLFMLMVLVSMFKPNIYWLFALMLFFSWTVLVNLVRAEFLRARQLDYVRAARALGLPNWMIICRHILPNVIGSSLSQLPFILCGNITALTALDFLGYGLPLNYASMGELLAQAKNNLHAPWIACSVVISLALILSVLIYMGEALRDAFDPRQD